MNEQVQDNVERVFNKFVLNALMYELNASKEKTTPLEFRRAQPNPTEEGRTVVGGINFRVEESKKEAAGGGATACIM